MPVAIEVAADFAAASAAPVVAAAFMLPSPEKIRGRAGSARGCRDRVCCLSSLDGLVELASVMGSSRIGMLWISAVELNLLEDHWYDSSYWCSGMIAFKSSFIICCVMFSSALCCQHELMKCA